MAPISENVGYWGPPTSTLDWCERNYEVNHYIAEFWNTLTNLSMIIPALWGLYDTYKQKFESRFAILYFFLLLTGIGSWMFHMTLLFGMQLLDELPMVWGSSYMVYNLYRVRIPAKEDTSAMGLFMFGFASVVTIVYLVNKDPFFHEAMYGVLVFALLGMDLHLNTIQYSRPGIKVFLFGFVMYLSGFILWNIDNWYCQQLTHFRSNAQMGSANLVLPLTQLHGWWHILAGYATYLHIQSCIHHRQRFIYQDCEFQRSWIGISVVRTAPPTKDKKKAK